MANFIKLHDAENGNESYVNMDKVYEISEGYYGGTIMTSETYTFHVKETPREIMKMLRGEIE